MYRGKHQTPPSNDALDQNFHWNIFLTTREKPQVTGEICENGSAKMNINQPERESFDLSTPLCYLPR